MSFLGFLLNKLNAGFGILPSEQAQYFYNRNINFYIGSLLMLAIQMGFPVQVSLIWVLGVCWCSH